MKELVYLTTPNRDFESAYIATRTLEGWIYADDEVAKLPVVSDNDRHKGIWQIREKTANDFIEYLTTQGVSSVLDLGCGNGWFSARIAQSGITVDGTDINEFELLQACRVFKQENLRFLYADVFEAQFDRTYDVVVLNGVIQYFEDPAKLLEALFPLLNFKGEIHILDSPIYRNTTQAKEAKQRTEDYYSKLLASQMAGNYHHHTYSDLPLFEAYRRTTGGVFKLFKPKDASPFPWMRFRKAAS